MKTRSPKTREKQEM